MKHLEDNFPGTINVFVKYTIEEEDKLGRTKAGTLGIEYDVRLLGDAKETAIAMTNHRSDIYWRLLIPVTSTSQMALPLTER